MLTQSQSQGCDITQASCPCRHLQLPLVRTERDWAFAMESQGQLDGEKAAKMRQSMLRRLSSADAHAAEFSRLAAARCDARSPPFPPRAFPSLPLLLSASHSSQQVMKPSLQKLVLEWKHGCGGLQRLHCSASLSLPLAPHSKRSARRVCLSNSISSKIGSDGYDFSMLASSMQVQVPVAEALADIGDLATALHTLISH